ncbi:MAG: hypothetical protein R3F02_13505 [Thiolinea sp.]
MRNFVGRKQWIDRFNDYMHPDDGLIWRITGVPGIGKSILLRRFAERCEEARRAHVFLDIEEFQAVHGLDILSELSKSARYFDTEKSNKKLSEKVSESIVKVKDGLGSSILEVGKLIDPSGVFSGSAKVLLDLGAGLADSAANMSEEAAAANPELFLLEALAAAGDDNKKPICLVDTFEHALAGELKLQSRLDFGFAEPRESTLKTQPLAEWLLSLFEFLISKGWRVVISGRNIPEINISEAKLIKSQLKEFSREEIYQAAKKHPVLNFYLSEHSDATLDVLSTLSYEGNPLCLKLATNLLALPDKEKNIEILVTKLNDVQQCYGKIQIQEYCAEALYRRSILLADELNEFELALESYDELIFRYEKNKRNKIQKYCSDSLYRVSTLFNEKFNDFDSALTVYEKILQHYKDNSDKFIKELWVKTLFNKGEMLLTKRNTPERAIKCFDTLLNYYNDIFTRSKSVHLLEPPYTGVDPELVVQEWAVKALNLKGIALSRLNQLSDAIATFEELITHYGENKKPQVQQQCQSARVNIVEAALLLGQTQTTQKYINQALEQTTSKNQAYAIMPFLRWLAAPENPQQNILTAIHELDPEVEFTWDWNDIRPLIDQLPEPQKTQAECYIAYFEEHQNIEKLETCLSHT